jgi:hypothetical protein
VASPTITARPTYSATETAPPEAIPQSTATATPTAALPSEPVLVGTTTSDGRETYQISVAALPESIDVDTVTERATQIGALVGLGAPASVEPGPDDHWTSKWPEVIDGYPTAADRPPFFVLEMDAYGAVVDFYRMIVPTEPVPDPVLTKAQATATVGGTVGSALLQWEADDSGSLRLVWRINYSDPGKSCSKAVDAGTGAVLSLNCGVVAEPGP